MAFPSTLSSLTDPQATDRLNSPSHSGIERAQNAAIEQVEAVIGTSSSTVGTMMYDIHAPTSDGGGHIQTASKGGTGQTQYTKGDLLVGQSSSVLTKLSVGTTGQVLIADSTTAVGAKWGSPTGANVQSFVGSIGGVSSGFWAKPSNIALTSRVFVEMWGGGGGGANGLAGTDEAGGGGGGGYASGWFTPSLLGATELVVVGQGGLGVQDSGGANGGITVFGTTSSLLTAYAGGGGGKSGSGGGGGGGGAPLGSGTVGSGATPGNSGTPGSVWGGQGGATLTNGGVGIYGGGGAGDGAVGGTALYGGAGGGGAKASVAGAGGVSMYGGAGGAGHTSPTAGGNGSIPAGGGGASNGSVMSGSGGPGKVIVTTII